MIFPVGLVRGRVITGLMSDSGRQKTFLECFQGVVGPNRGQISASGVG